MKKILILIVLLAHFSFAMIGAGFHWGWDFSVSLPNTEQEYLSFDTENSDDVDAAKDFLYTYIALTDTSLDSSTIDSLVTDISTSVPFSNGALPLYISRKNFDRTPINFGAKILIDALPVEFDISFNVGQWLYDATIYYPNGMVSSIDPADYQTIFTYDSLSLDPRTLGLSKFDVDQTPFTKVNLDVDLRKTFGKHIVHPYIGAGVSFHWATPIITAELVNKALDGSATSGKSIDEIMQGDMSELVNHLIEDAQKEVEVGMNILLGFHIKPPIIPLAIYGDAKYHFIFDSEPFNTTSGLNITGFQLNAGLMVYIPNIKKEN